jgi:exopolyphosphatase/pppGpp-phosphohydrolase
MPAPGGRFNGTTPDAGPASIELPPGAVVAAAIDAGATSLHLLVAAVGSHHVAPILDESVFLGLGDRVTADGVIGASAREELAASVVAYVDAARRLGASAVTLVGTEPLRRALDAATVIGEVEARAGVPFHVLEHEEEGRLNLLGVTLGHPLAAEMLVVDVGGGSSEFVDVRPDGVVSASGLPLGAARLTLEHVHSDPPAAAEIEALRAAVRGILESAPDAAPREIVAVGGTASNLLRLMLSAALDRLLTRQRLAVALELLTTERSLDVADRHLIRPARARILPAGAIIMDAILERYDIDSLRVAEEGLREGLALATATAGPAWRDRLGVLVRGWNGATDGADAGRED